MKNKIPWFVLVAVFALAFLSISVVWDNGKMKAEISELKTENKILRSIFVKPIEQEPHNMTFAYTDPISNLTWHVDIEGCNPIKSYVYEMEEAKIREDSPDNLLPERGNFK